MKDIDIEIDNDSTENNEQNVSTEVQSDNTQSDNVDMPKKKNEENIVEINDDEVKITSNVYDNQTIDIKENEVLKGESGSQVIGKVDGVSITPTNKPLPKQIDITVKQKVEKKTNQKRVKVVTKKERIISFFVTLFVILIIGASGYAVYYYGYQNNPSIYKVKNVSFELGSELPQSASYYVTSPLKVDDMEYTLDISQVADGIGNYPYSVKHKNVVKSGIITIQDTTKPELKIKENLIFNKDDKIDVDQLVDGCSDLSGCDYKLAFDINTDSAGEKEVIVTASDSQNNQTEEKFTITVVDIQKSIVCTSKKIQSDDSKYNVYNEYTLNFDGNDYLVSSSGARVFKYLEAGYDDYFTIYYQKQGEQHSEYTFNKESFSYSLKVDVDTKNLTNRNSLIDYFVEDGYSCKEKDI